MSNVFAMHFVDCQANFEKSVHNPDFMHRCISSIQSFYLSFQVVVGLRESWHPKINFRWIRVFDHTLVRIKSHYVKSISKSVHRSDLVDSHISIHLIFQSEDFDDISLSEFDEIF